MEKKIKLEDIIKFINNAKNSDYDISIYYLEENDCNNQVVIYKSLSDNKISRQAFSWKNLGDKLIINLTSEYCNYDSDYIVEVENKKDILKWEMFIEELIDYTHSRLEFNFKNFFKDEENKVKDINDLDNEDE